MPKKPDEEPVIADVPSLADLGYDIPDDVPEFASRGKAPWPVPSATIEEVAGIPVLIAACNILPSRYLDEKTGETKYYAEILFEPLEGGGARWLRTSAVAVVDSLKRQGPPRKGRFMKLPGQRYWVLVGLSE